MNPITPIIIVGALIYAAMLVAAYRKARNHGEEDRRPEEGGTQEEDGRARA